VEIERIVGAVQARLDELADEGRREWWTRYLKQEASFRGVTMAQVRTQVNEVWASEVSGWPAAQAKELALAFLHAEQSEDKLAGVLLLAEKLSGELTVDDLPLLASPFADGSISDWNVCDWFSVKVLSQLCRRDGRAFADPLARWVDADGLWQRRAPAVALAPLASKRQPFDRFADLCLAICERLTADPQRFSQTAVGWLLRELSKPEPGAVLAFVEAHADRLSREARRMATARLEGRARR
jgi:3-methyladenine DNA glycosylase AlkD